MENKLFVGVISIFGVICIPLLLTYIKAASDYIDTFIANKINQIKYLAAHWKKTLFIYLHIRYYNSSRRFIGENYLQ